MNRQRGWAVYAWSRMTGTWCLFAVGNSKEEVLLDLADSRANNDGYPEQFQVGRLPKRVKRDQGLFRSCGLEVLGRYVAPFGRRFWRWYTGGGGRMRPSDQDLRIEIIRANERARWRALSSANREILTRVQANREIEKILEHAHEQAFRDWPDEPRKALACWISNEMECPEEPTDLSACWVPGGNADELAEYLITDEDIQDYWTSVDEYLHPWKAYGWNY